MSRYLGFYIAVFLILAFGGYCPAQDSLMKDTVADTAPKHRPWKVSKKEFIRLYSNGNDTLASLIDRWYRGRTNAIIKTAGLPLSFLMIFGEDAVSDGYMEAWAPLSTLVAGTAFSTNGLVQLSVYTRKNLYEIVEKHQQGVALPKTVRKMAESNLLRQNSRLTQDEFLEKFGTDDTAAALIRMFFRKRNEGWVLTSFLPSGILTAYAIGSLDLARQTSGCEECSVSPVMTIVAVVLVGIPSLCVSVSGLFSVAAYTKRKLYRSLLEYQKDKYISFSLWKKLRPRDFKN